MREGCRRGDVGTRLFKLWPKNRKDVTASNRTDLRLNTKRGQREVGGRAMRRMDECT